MSDDLSSWPTTTGSPRTAPTEAGTCSVTTPTSASSRTSAARPRTPTSRRCATSCRRAEAVDPDGLDDDQRLTREAVIASATHHRGPDRRRPLTGLAANPVSGPQRAARARPRPAVRARRGRRRADARQVRRGRGRTSRSWPSGTREGAADGWVSAEFAVARDPRAARRGCWPTPSTTTRCSPRSGLARRGRRRRAGAPAARRRRAVRPARLRGVPRRAPRRGRCRTRGPTSGAGSRWLAGRRRGVRRDACATSRPPTSRPQEIHEIGLAPGRQARRRVPRPRPRGGRHRRPRDDLRRRCGPTRSCTSSTATSSSSTRRSRWPGPRPRWASGSRCCRRRRAPSRAPTVGAKAFYFAPATDGSRGGTFFVNTADAVGLGTLRARGDGLPRGHPGPPPPAGDRGRAAGRRSRSSASTSTTRRTPRAGGSTPSGSPTRWACTPRALDRMGMYSADSMRACRLVVDTGLHALGLEPAAGDRLHGGQLPADRGRLPTRGRPLHLPPRPGDVVHGRPAGDRADPPRGRAAAGRPLRRTPLPLRRARQRLTPTRRPRPGGRGPADLIAPTRRRIAAGWLSVGNPVVAPPRLGRCPGSRGRWLEEG